MDIKEDLHVHSTYSDGKGALPENLRAAEELGLTRLGFTDHVRKDTDWIPEYLREIRALQQVTGIELSAGIEAKLLDTHGEIDVPHRHSADLLYIADHQVPSPLGPINPKTVQKALHAQRITRSQVLEWLRSSYLNAIWRNQRVVIAHFFSVLPKIGLSESEQQFSFWEPVVEAAAKCKALVEIDERWRCPSLRVAKWFDDAGVPIVASSDAHMPRKIGRYTYVVEVFEGLYGSRSLPLTPKQAANGQ